MTFWDDNATPAGVFNVGDMYDEYTARQAVFIIEQLDVTDGLLVDLGCGIGRLSDAVLGRLRDVDAVIGVDPSWPMLDKADRRLGSTRFIPWYTLTPGRLAGGVHGAWCVLTFQHLPDDTVQEHLADLFEILKPGARLVTQWVTHGEEGPMSYPRLPNMIYDWHREAGFRRCRGISDDWVTRYADNWAWFTAEKPA